MSCKTISPNVEVNSKGAENNIREVCENVTKMIGIVSNLPRITDHELFVLVDKLIGTYAVSVERLISNNIQINGNNFENKILAEYDQSI